MKKIYIILFLNIAMKLICADPQNLINQYQFNTLISTYEVSQVISDIKNNNVTLIQISYLAGDLLSAQQLKYMILQQSPIHVQVTLESLGNQISYIINYQQTPITASVYGTPGNNGSNNSNIQGNGSFYNYTTKDSGFYDE